MIGEDERASTRRGRRGRAGLHLNMASGGCRLGFAMHEVGVKRSGRRLRRGPSGWSMNASSMVVASWSRRSQMRSSRRHGPDGGRRSSPWQRDATLCGGAPAGSWHRRAPARALQPGGVRGDASRPLRICGRGCRQAVGVAPGVDWSRRIASARHGPQGPLGERPPPTDAAELVEITKATLAVHGRRRAASSFRTLPAPRRSPRSGRRSRCPSLLPGTFSCPQTSSRWLTPSPGAGLGDTRQLAWPRDVGCGPAAGQHLDTPGGGRCGRGNRRPGRLPSAQAVRILATRSVTPQGT